MQFLGEWRTCNSPVRSWVYAAANRSGPFRPAWTGALVPSALAGGVCTEIASLHNWPILHPSEPYGVWLVPNAKAIACANFRPSRSVVVGYGKSKGSVFVTRVEDRQSGKRRVGRSGCRGRRLECCESTGPVQIELSGAVRSCRVRWRACSSW